MRGREGRLKLNLRLKMERSKLFLLIGIFWLIIIIGFVAVKEYTLQTGTEVLLKTIPVDPRDLFRGDYITLNYEISTLDLSSLKTDSIGFNNNDWVYVALNKKDIYEIPSGVYKNAPKEELFIKGVVKYVRDNKLGIEYGIESYFVPEGEGKEIERLQRSQTLDVQVSIDKFGNAVIKKLLIDGKEADFKS